MSETYATGGQDDTAAGKVILMVASALSAVLVIGGLFYAMGAGARHQAGAAAAGCEPSLYIMGLPCTTQQMLVSQYQSIVTPVTQQLNTDMAAYATSEKHNLTAAKAVLTAEVATEQAFNNSLAAVAFTPQNRATALALITNATSNGTSTVPPAAVTFTPQITVIANALMRANQTRAMLTAEQARATSLTKLRSFNQRVKAAAAVVQTELTLLLKAIDTPPQWG
jgi:hypothetical protein